MICEQNSSIVMEIVTDPKELAEAASRCDQFDRNMAWLQAHAHEVFTQHRGQCIIIAQQNCLLPTKQRKPSPRQQRIERSRYTHSTFRRKKTQYMRIDGCWLQCMTVSVTWIRCEVQRANKSWQPAVSWMLVRIAQCSLLHFSQNWEESRLLLSSQSAVLAAQPLP